MSNALQPPPSALFNLGVAVAQWFQDTWKKLSTLQTQANSALYISGLKLTNASPDGGDIAWSACTVYYNGAAYSISAGNTTGGNKLVWWNVGDTTFSSGNSYAPGPNTFGILTNNLGTADTTWDKVGAQSVQSTQLLGFPFGYQLQQPATGSITTSDHPSLTLLNYSGGSGVVISIEIDLAGNASDLNDEIDLFWQADGATQQSLKLINQNNIPGVFTTPITNIAQFQSGSPVTKIIWSCNLPFLSSIVISIGPKTSVVNGWNGGTLNATVCYATKT